ncbi:sugar phosphate isomerase/epimerase family protein [Nocardia sp. NBC_00511]|uniref:sugar phosphate isomerase/epimerase family protein n=1 Tax=Nocardia sp. NBC_00511 TaxID=2903591 RepID=UPI0030E0B369
MDRLAIEALSVFGLPPVEFVDLAADLDCRRITVFLQPLATLGYPPYSLRDDAALRRDLLAALKGRDVEITLGDGILLYPGLDMRTLQTDLDLLATLGVPRINAIGLDPDLSRTLDQLATVTELAAQRSMETLLEPVPGLPIPDLPTAQVALNHVARPDFRLLIDTMHLTRSGATVADLAAVNPTDIGYAQISDTTLHPRLDNYAEEAMYERLVPGEGELPLSALLAVLPADIIVGIEVPSRTKALAGVPPAARLRPCLDATRALLADLPRQ